MKCKDFLSLSFMVSERLSILSERGVRRVPDLLPEDYTGGDKDHGSIGL